MAVDTIPSSRSTTLRLLLASDLSEVRPMAGVVHKFLREEGAASDEIHACELALSEACNNAIQYVAAEGEGKQVQVDVLCAPEQIEMRVMDHTAGFDWPDRVELPGDDQESGRGLYLISSLMDRVNYFRGKGQNWLVMRRKRPLQKPLPVREQSEAERRLGESERVVRDMAEELSFCYESLSAIFRCSADVGRTNDLEDFARRLLTDLVQITSAEWFVLRLTAPGEDHLELFVGSEPEMLPERIPLNDSSSRSVECEAALAREDVWFDHLSPLGNGDPLSKVKPGSMGLVHPIFLGETLIGTLAIAKSAESEGFTAVQANVIHTFSDFLAIQIVNSKYTEEQVRNRLISRELEIAKTIQRSLLPKTLPRIPGCNLAGFCESANQVGGDFYDVIKISDDSLLLIIADVMGKGIPAAIFAAILRSLVRAVPEWMDKPATLLGRVNRLLFEELSGVDMFITAQLVYVDSKNRRITAASAGHCPVLLALDGEGNVKTLAPDGLPLGILPDTTFSHQTEVLPKNCRVLLYTDGLTEARNAQGDFFGQERLLRWLKQSSGTRKTAEELKEDLAAELISFQASNNLSDDQTFLIMTE